MRVFFKDHVNEADDRVALEGSDSEVGRARGHQSRVSHREPVGKHIPVQERIKVAPDSVVASSQHAAPFSGIDQMTQARIPSQQRRPHH